MKRLMLLLAVVALTVAPAAAQDVVKIGQIEAQTGAIAIYGWMGSQGAALAVDEINKAGGFKVGDKTYKLELIALDTRGDPKEATVQLKRLLEQDQAQFVFGPFLSNVFLAVRPYARVQRQVPHDGRRHPHPRLRGHPGQRVPDAHLELDAVRAASAS